MRGESKRIWVRYITSDGQEGLQESVGVYVWDTDKDVLVVLADDDYRHEWPRSRVVEITSAHL